MTESSIVNKVKSLTHLVGKYGSTSVMASTSDFTVFHFVMTYAGLTPVQATIVGRSCGACVAFMFHRNWVFAKNSMYGESNATHRFSVLLVRYLLGVLLGMSLNVTGVWLLNTVFEINPWISRIATAASVWFLVFAYNKQVVFKERIIAEQDFSELAEEDTKEII